MAAAPQAAQLVVVFVIPVFWFSLLIILFL